MKQFGDLASKLTGGAGAAQSGQGLIQSVLEMLSNRPGGISGLVQAFQEKGLDHIVSSWIGTGENLPVSSDQIRQVLGEQQVKEFAQKTGTSTENASSQLANVLPGVVDKLTPNGEVPQGGDLMSTGKKLLQNWMLGSK